MKMNNVQVERSEFAIIIKRYTAVTVTKKSIYSQTAFKWSGREMGKFIVLFFIVLHKKIHPYAF